MSRAIEVPNWLRDNIVELIVAEWRAGERDAGDIYSRARDYFPVSFGFYNECADAAWIIVQNDEAAQ